MSKSVKTEPGKEVKQSKWSKYKKKYKKEWEVIPEFKYWLSESSLGDFYAFCKACKRHMRAHRHDLVKHVSTSKHM